MQKDKFIFCRVNKDEEKIIKEKLKKSKFNNLSEYIRNILLKKEVNIIDFEIIRKRNYEINKIGNNINQIAKRVNTINEFYYEDFVEFQKEFTKMINENKKINEDIIKIIKGK